MTTVIAVAASPINLLASSRFARRGSGVVAPMSCAPPMSAAAAASAAAGRCRRPLGLAQLVSGRLPVEFPYGIPTDIAVVPLACPEVSPRVQAAFPRRFGGRFRPFPPVSARFRVGFRRFARIHLFCNV